VTLNWQIRGARESRSLALEWREQGGPKVGPPSRKGFGSTLIERVLRQEQGRSAFDYRPEGVVCTLEMKL
jgi:two-component sensor histidine kinase